ncbi:hypothetical protein GUITHDRAFT_136408 [Guillardia theta CCMP2712]|uniref:Uncharacterized protein n=2 Tax=Guillardia theta TaxID=55529 RepID=L1JKV8_GUITC|nr:hypothetical protein GUITHDRAFT_136408 [Guillardia theta CCMP2712]EKX48720.1 hypothetical protein GUITHDRAFT_136408 [Guillardia theta CCMP2712]|mmetsp:Transcript_7189/g.24887  ORF Transcript_7189/g.24887 Transcript_7189/m.24887 type:complete len:354 (+) Transcript_7189:174-1235(+)|eukprot:XP_005835700.1 hypothetical protein GUITHDRAFT_136408 [Guillardia theta CCMP2712]
MSSMVGPSATGEKQIKYTRLNVAPPQANRNEADQPLSSKFLQNIQIITRGVAYCLSGHVCTIGAATVVAIFICSRAFLNIRFTTSLEVVAYGTVFPLTFGIQVAFDNRERALDGLACIKSMIASIFFLLKSWEVGKGGKIQRAFTPYFNELVENMQKYCIREQVRHSDGQESADHLVYDTFAKIAAEIELQSSTLGYESGTKGGQMGKGRAWECLKRMICAWEDVKMARCYISPRGLRCFCFFTIHVAPIVLAPYWLDFCKSEQGAETLDPLYGCYSAYFLGITFSVILITLHRIRDALDSPFTTTDFDQIKWQFWKEQMTQLNSFGPNGPELRESLGYGVGCHGEMAERGCY